MLDSKFGFFLVLSLLLTGQIINFCGVRDDYPFSSFPMYSGKFSSENVKVVEFLVVESDRSSVHLNTLIRPLQEKVLGEFINKLDLQFPFEKRTLDLIQSIGDANLKSLRKRKKYQSKIFKIKINYWDFFDTKKINNPDEVIVVYSEQI